jgi:adenylate cyclase
MEILRGLRPARFAAVIGVAAAIGMALALSDQAQRLDWAVDDRFVRVAARVAAPPDDVVIVAIDEPSFSELRRPWPWPRRMHGALVDAIARGGARTIVFDVVFDMPAVDPEDDRLFVEAVQRAGNVILAADVSETADSQYAVVQWAEPFEALAGAAAGSGAVKLPIDPDGVVRRATLAVEGRAGLAFAAVRRAGATRAAAPGVDDPARKSSTASTTAAAVASAPALAGADAMVGAQAVRVIGFRGQPRLGIRTVSYYQALEAEKLLPADIFRGKTVFVGRSLQATVASDQADYFQTPLGLMAGVEIHASLFDTLVRGRAPADPFASRAALLLFCGILAAITGWLCYKVSPSIVGAIIGIAAIVTFGTAYALRAHDVLRLPIVSPLAVCGTIFVASTAYRYALGTRERRMITRAFEHYVAPAIVKQMLEDPSKLSLNGEEYDSTIIFTDLEGFSALAERVAPGEVRAHLSRYLTAMTDCLLAEHGTLDRFIGDAILGYFGCPVRDASHPAQACRAALVMQRRMRELNSEWEAAGLPRLRMRMGLNTGRVVAGNMGTDTVFHYTIIGDAVNLASRLESVNKIYGTDMLAGEETRRLAGDEFVWREIDRVKVKGRATAATIYTLVGQIGDSREPDTAPSVGEHYAAGLASYRARDWKRASYCFRSALAIDASDGPSRAMLARCEMYAASPTPPTETWDGVFELTEK